MSGAELSRRLQLFYLAIEKAPMTNIKSLNGEILTYATALFLAIAAVLKVTIDEAILYAWLIFLSGKIGFAMGGAWVKRTTSTEYQEGKAKVEAAKALGSSTPLANVEGDATIMNTTAERRVPAPSRSTDVQSGAAPDDGAVG